MADQAHCLGFLAIEHTRREDELLRQGHPDGTRQPLRSPYSEDETENACDDLTPFRFNISIFHFFYWKNKPGAQVFMLKLSNWKTTSKLNLISSLVSKIIKTLKALKESCITMK